MVISISLIPCGFIKIHSAIQKSTLLYLLTFPFICLYLFGVTDNYFSHCSLIGPTLAIGCSLNLVFMEFFELLPSLCEYFYTFCYLKMFQFYLEFFSVLVLSGISCFSKSPGFFNPLIGNNV